MSTKAKIRNLLLRKGFFPEVLPPCFDSSNLHKSFVGIKQSLEESKFHNRASNYIRYSGTKHDGNRRNYGTVNPIPYFNICSFIGEHWDQFQAKQNKSKYGLTSLSLADENADRALLVPALSEVTTMLSRKIKYAPFIVKTDISQFFPSIYTHAISWVAHGVSESKNDTNRKSDINFFNSLDWFTQQCQNAQTRGVIIGPDAFRILAEFIACEIDIELQKKAGDFIVGAVRHVDDFFIGIRSELDSSIVLSHLREVLQNYELQVNDSKTKLLSGLQPIDDIWAQELRSIQISKSYTSSEKFNYILDKAFDIAQSIGSQSPIKLAVRRLDREKCYVGSSWAEVEPKLQRILFHFPHTLDYVCLLLVKRVAIKGIIDSESWASIINMLLNKHITSNHHHEICWLLWVNLTCKLDLTNDLLAKLSAIQNSHIKALLIAGFQAKLIKSRPPIKLERKLSTTDENWLHNLVAKATGYTSAPFTGGYATEFTHLANRGIKLIDFKKHFKAVAQANNAAISNSKYGYDSDNQHDDYEFNLADDDGDLPF